jgi:NAD(P)-dependent dehydrogenase (short-subunit alcohol dehydrogenase family)
MITLQNKTALVTGASRGSGRATAAALARAGAHVLVQYGISRLRDPSARRTGESDRGPVLLAKQVRVTEEQSKSGTPRFGTILPTHAAKGTSLDA